MNYRNTFFPLAIGVFIGSVVAFLLGREGKPPEPQFEVGQRLTVNNCFSHGEHSLSIQADLNWYTYKRPFLADYQLETTVEGFCDHLEFVWPTKLEGNWYLCKGLGRDNCIPVRLVK